MADNSVPDYQSTHRAYSDIYEQYFNDAAFFWLLRSIAVEQPHYTASDLLELENRVEAQLNGLVTSLDISWGLCEAALEQNDPGEIFTAAVLAFKSHDVQRIQQSVQAGLSNSHTDKGLISALGWLPGHISTPWIQKFFSSKDLNHKYLALAACSVRREDPKDQLNKLLAREDCLAENKLHARACRLIGELRRQDCMPAIKQAQRNADENVTFWANWSAVLLGDHTSIQRLKPYMLEAGPYQDLVIQQAFRILPVEQAREWISNLSEDDLQHRAVIKAIGVLGDPHAVNWLINKMQEPRLAKLAAESFANITGVDFEKHQLILDAPKNYPVIPNADIDDDNTGLDEDENLPYPNVEKITSLWRNHGQNFIVGRRYFMGRPITAELLKNKLQHGTQRQRHAAAMELALNESDVQLVNTRARVVAS